jgi:hypothetical protein
MSIDPKLAQRAVLFLAALTVIVGPAALHRYRTLDAARQTADHGAMLAAGICGTCHIQPTPDILPVRSWRAALGYMGFYLGKTNLDYLRQDPEFAQQNVASRYGNLRRDGVVPEQPLLDDADWEALRFYYLSHAPETALPQTGKPPLRWDLDRFEPIPTDYRIPGAVTTLVRIRPEQQEIYLGDSVSGILTVLDGNGRLKVTARRYEPAISPVDIEFVGATAYLASIGDLMAVQSAEARPGHILALPLENGSLSRGPATLVLDKLYRLADIHSVDLNEDGQADHLACGFGAATGAVSLFASQPDGSYVEQVLLNLPGCVRILTHDFNADGRLDIAALVADAREGLHILLNQGGGRFEDHTVFRTHPAYGHTYFELQDFNHDGLADILAVNGDNVDSDPYNTPKNYHGVRIYMNMGDLKFEQRYFYPLYGAFSAKAADFDADGDLDIAAISFYPDFRAERPESFVLLEQTGELEFAPASLPVVTTGRWLTMDIGDIDGDSDVDVVLGGGYVPVGMFAHMELFEQLRQTGPSILILKNRLR